MKEYILFEYPDTTVEAVLSVIGVLIGIAILYGINLLFKKAKK